MVRYYVAEYIGTRGRGFMAGHTYPIAVKKRFFRKRISVYQRRGYYDEMARGTLHHFPNQWAFDTCWKIIKRG